MSCLAATDNTASETLGIRKPQVLASPHRDLDLPPTGQPSQSIPQATEQSEAPHLSIQGAFNLKGRYADFPKTDPRVNSFFELLKGRDHVRNLIDSLCAANRFHKFFLVDVSRSMREHLKSAAEVVMILRWLMESCQPNQPYICFSGSPKAKKMPKDATIFEIAEQHFNSSSATSSSFQKTFASILRAHYQRLGKLQIAEKMKHPMSHPAKGPRKFSLYILTDAVWDPSTDLKPDIGLLADHLKDPDVENHQTGIQFIQFGNHPYGSERLRNMAFKKEWGV